MPRQPVVRHNDWSTLTPHDLGGWTPTLSVSVVIPTWRAERTLPLVLAGLAAQSYPSHLLEVVVVDDGNEPPVTLPEVRPDNTRVVRVTSGWGRANACRTGALAGDGDVIHWLDSDMLAYREHVEAQLRWHHLLDYAVVLGTKRFVDPSSLLDRDPAEVRDIVAAGRAEELFDADDSEPHTWVEGMWRRTDDLTLAGPRAFRAHVGATGSLTRALYDDAGGMDPTLVLGEDVELGHRLARSGGVLIPDHAAQSWHLGRSHVMQNKDAVNRHNDTFLADLAPTMRPKRNVRGRTYQVPYLEAVVPAGAADETIRLVDSLLDGDVPDLRVLVLGPWSTVGDDRVSPLTDPALDLRLVERTYRHEPRVRLVEPSVGSGGVESLPPDTDAEFRLILPGVDFAPLGPALDLLLADLERTHHGARVLAFPDGSAAQLVRTAALARVARVLADGDDPDELLDRIAGVVSYDATSVGFVPTMEREVERFVLKAKSAIDPADSTNLLRKALARATGRRGPARAAMPAPPGVHHDAVPPAFEPRPPAGRPDSGRNGGSGPVVPAPAPAGGRADDDSAEVRRGLFGRRR
ncbi:glycosyltransferase family 2 protein [Nocardioides seonyuensis]|uniref:4,4'-diaponeurosporenoate glycosyltransferase n=1 Tax=Nocardioides seonyuensis TaxID=2518371 RepID=A0A4P7IE62_9ACTN|nr:glycosyltransferase family 2 protein [Nocardioides seonyuensis]QBX55505.1 glycosyltransferase family 2 protein [Nocardioides seonyuensis]